MLLGSVSGQGSCCEYRWLLGSACLPGARSGTAEPVPPGLCQHRGGGHPHVRPRGCTRELRAGLEEPACVAGCQPLGREESCLEISRRLRHATWTAGPGTGHAGTVPRGSRVEGAQLCMCPACGMKLPQALVPSPAPGPPLQGQVPAKAPSAEVHHPSVCGEMHVHLRAAGPWQGGPGMAWIASLANKAGLLLPVRALADETDKLPQHLPPSP